MIISTHFYAGKYENILKVILLVIITLRKVTHYVA